MVERAQCVRRGSTSSIEIIWMEILRKLPERLPSSRSRSSPNHPLLVSHIISYPTELDPTHDARSMCDMN